jgi:hypothetical protein
MEGTVNIAPKRIISVTAIASTGTAIDVDVNGKEFYIQNTHASIVLYFKEKNGVAATAANGYAVAAGAQFPSVHSLTADTLSVFAANGGTGRIIFLE